MGKEMPERAHVALCLVGFDLDDCQRMKFRCTRFPF
jgi:hypothetical protein